MQPGRMNQGNRAQAQAGGFTLIELVVVMFVIILMTVAVAPSLSRLLKNSRVQEAAQTVTAALYRARGEAMRYRSCVALLYGDDPSKIPAGRWAPPVSTTLPPNNKMEIWTMKTDLAGNVNTLYRESGNGWAEDGLTATMTSPHNPIGPPQAWVNWFPFFSKIRLLSNDLTFPQGTRIIAGNFTSSTRHFHAKPDGNSFKPDSVGEIKRHESVYSSNGSVPTHTDLYVFRYVMIFDEASNEHVVIEVGEWKSVSRPRIVCRNLLIVNSIPLTSTTLIDSTID
jgi:type II secretory pathway pseudopilin PulG